MRTLRASWFLGGITAAGLGTVWLVSVHPARATAPQQHIAAAVHASAKTVPRPQLPPMTLEPSAPLTIYIPRLGVHASVTAAGLTANGEMQAPAGKDGVTWLKSGYLPGTYGNAVMAGHSQHRNGAGTFYNLSNIQPNDSIEVTTTSRILTFSVREKISYPNDAAERSRIFGDSKQAHLNLITCEGQWDEHNRDFTNRLVVFSDFVSERSL